MKLSIATVLLATTSSATAFAPQSNSWRASPVSTQMSSDTPPSSEEIKKAIKTGEPVEEEATFPTSSSSRQSRAIPFLEASPALDGTMVGDVGFDPLGFAQTKDDLLKYREAEIKHGRLAMLAAAGWPLSEVFEKKIANGLGLSAVLDETDRAPSILNGGLGKISPIYWVGCLAAAAAIDLYGQKVSKQPGYTPGNLGFDPLGMYPDNPQQQQFMQLAELKNGRLAMIAITAFAAQEFVTSQGVVDQTPLFFKPVSEVIPYAY